ncbi:MAG: hypothetical protein COW84_01335 [Gammaproteobacteria bacterium CG22_combo_CG10-13_8_21_14_all_40_8]|nr:MAG: hypothetical protein COW84_01335 [Gammaproteobacteria bacterium CG22_combo_CG10-13_8_21_14_all_40_8]
MSLSCHDVTQLSTEYVDQELDWKAKLRVRFHLLMCHKCRRFVRHVDTVHQYVQKLHEPSALNEQELDAIMQKIHDGKCKDA